MSKTCTEPSSLPDASSLPSSRHDAVQTGSLKRESVFLSVHVAESKICTRVEDATARSCAPEAGQNSRLLTLASCFEMCTCANLLQ